MKKINFILSLVLAAGVATNALHAAAGAPAPAQPAPAQPAPAQPAPAQPTPAQSSPAQSSLWSLLSQKDDAARTLRKEANSNLKGNTDFDNRLQRVLGDQNAAYFKLEEICNSQLDLPTKKHPNASANLPENHEDLNKAIAQYLDVNGFCSHTKPALALTGITAICVFLAYYTSKKNTTLSQMVKTNRKKALIILGVAIAVHQLFVNLTYKSTALHEGFLGGFCDKNMQNIHGIVSSFKDLGIASTWKKAAVGTVGVFDFFLVLYSSNAAFKNYVNKLISRK